MKTIRYVGLIAALAMPFAAASESSETADFRRVVDEYMAALRRNDAQAVNAYWTANAAYLGNAMPDIRGRTDLSSTVAALFSSAQVEYTKVTIDDIHATAGMGIVSGVSEAVIKPKGQSSVTKTERYLWVFRRESDRWKLALAMGNELPAASPAKESHESEGTITSAPFELRFRVEGIGTPAIVIGFPLYYTRAFSQNLRKHLRLVFVDHRGSAKSPGKVAVNEFGMDKLVDDIERIRTQLGLGQIIVIGHSGNSYMALEYAKKYPAHVSHVVMIGISPDLSAASQAAAKRYWNESASPERKQILAENVKRLPDEELAKIPAAERNSRAYVRDGPKIWFDPRFDSTPLWEGVTLNPDMFAHVWGKLFSEIDITKGLHDFDRPVFLALGRHDFLLAPPSAWDAVRPKFRVLTVRVFERSGHTPQYEEPELFDAELLKWLNAKAARNHTKRDNTQ